MNYFSFHIGDYAARTRFLSPMADLAYRRLLDLYYTLEGPIPALDVASEIGLSDYPTDVDLVLRKFFAEVDGYWHHERCDEEVAKYQEKAERNREVGKLGGRPRKPTENPDGFQKEPIGNPPKNQEPITKKEKAPAAPSLTVEELKAEGLAEETATEFLAHRNRKRAKLTRKAWEGIKDEIEKAHWSPERAIAKCLSRGWVAFEADWVKDEKTRKADLAVATVPADPESFNRTREEPMTPEQWAAAKKARALAMGAIKNITPKAVA